MKKKQSYIKPSIRVKKIHFNVLFTNFNEDSLLAVGPGQQCCGNPKVFCPGSCSFCTSCFNSGWCAC